MVYRPTRYEMETIIRFDEEGTEATLYTVSPVWMRRMDRAMKENPVDFHVEGEDKRDNETIAKTYSFPKSFLSVRTKRRTLTEEQRIANAERLRKVREINSEAKTPSSNQEFED